MAYNLQLAERIRARLSGLEPVEEIAMMGGLVFMYHGKMCVGIIKNELLCRIDPLLRDELLLKDGCSEMAFSGRVMKGFVLVEPRVTKTEKSFNYWIQLCLDFNPSAKASKRKP